MIDVLYALLIMFGLRHPAPAVYHTPIKTIPLVIEDDPAVLDCEDWGVILTEQVQN